jgi:hypothetical protein
VAQVLGALVIMAAAAEEVQVLLGEMLLVHCLGMVALDCNILSVELLHSMPAVEGAVVEAIKALGAMAEVAMAEVQQQQEQQIPVVVAVAPLKVPQPEQADRVLLYFVTRTHFLPRQIPQDHQQLQSPVDLEFIYSMALEV